MHLYISIFFNSGLTVDLLPFRLHRITAIFLPTISVIQFIIDTPPENFFGAHPEFPSVLLNKEHIDR